MLQTDNLKMGSDPQLFSLSQDNKDRFRVDTGNTAGSAGVWETGGSSTNIPFWPEFESNKLLQGKIYMNDIIRLQMDLSFEVNSGTDNDVLFEYTVKVVLEEDGGFQTLYSFNDCLVGDFGNIVQKSYDAEFRNPTIHTPLQGSGQGVFIRVTVHTARIGQDDFVINSHGLTHYAQIVRVNNHGFAVIGSPNTRLSSRGIEGDFYLKPPIIERPTDDIGLSDILSKYEGRVVRVLKEGLNTNQKVYELWMIERDLVVT